MAGNLKPLINTARQFRLQQKVEKNNPGYQPKFHGQAWSKHILEVTFMEGCCMDSPGNQTFTVCEQACDIVAKHCFSNVIINIQSVNFIQFWFRISEWKVWSKHYSLVAVGFNIIRYFKGWCKCSICINIRVIPQAIIFYCSVPAVQSPQMGYDYPYSRSQFFNKQDSVFNSSSRTTGMFRFFISAMAFLHSVES